MSLKEFIKNNKYDYLWSCLFLFILASFIAMVRKIDFVNMIGGILLCFPIMFLMGFGIYEFSGGDKE
jgi:hypothetical protein